LNKNEVILMKRTYIILILILILTGVITVTAQTESPAEKRAKELVQFLNAGNRAEFQKYVEANFGAEMLRAPMDLHLNFFSSVYDNSRGYEISGVQDVKPNQATMLVKSKLTGEWDPLLVTVEGEAPYRITGIGFRPPKPPAGEAKKLSEKEIAREMEAFMKKLTAADVFSGAVLLAKDGVPVYKGAFGMANKDFEAANRIDTKFNLGSMNKMFTAVAIAQLVEKGKLSFEDSLSKFIPDFPDKESAEKIKIKHLLTHSAGLGGYFSDKWDRASRAQFRTVDDMMKMAKEDEKLLFEPGSRSRYSNTGMLVLGKVIEIVSGQSYYDYVRENIYKPAGMTNTDCYELDKVNHNLAVGYDKDYTETGITFSNNIFMHVMRGGPHGGGYSTVEDLLKFDRALRGNKLVGAEYVKILTTAKPELNSPNYGYGFGISSDGKSFGHSGGFPGINSNLDMFPESGWTLVVMSNYSRGGQPVMQKMRRLMEMYSGGAK
jgi:CubicO group peptidase (beta-lactamase class C family)